MVDCSFQILWGYGIRQPYAVFRAIEQQAVTGHPGRVNGEEDWPSVPPANFHGGFRIGGEVYLMSFHGPQPFPHDRTDKSLPSPMPQNRRGCVGYQFQIHGNGMSLIGTDHKCFEPLVRFVLCFHRKPREESRKRHDTVPE